MTDNPFVTRHERRMAAEKSYTVEKIREDHPAAYGPWTEGEEARLRELSDDGRTVEEIAQTLGRQPGGIRSRLRKLGINNNGTRNDEQRNN